MKLARRLLFWIVVAPFLMTLGQCSFYFTLGRVKKCEVLVDNAPACDFAGYNFRPAMKDFWEGMGANFQFLLIWLVIGGLIAFILNIIAMRRQKRT